MFIFISKLHSFKSGINIKAEIFKLGFIYRLLVVDLRMSRKKCDTHHISLSVDP